VQLLPQHVIGIFPEKGCIFTDDDDITSTANSWLEYQDRQFFYNGIRALEKCWTKCISVEEDYVEK